MRMYGFGTNWERDMGKVGDIGFLKSGLKSIYKLWLWLTF